MSKSQGNAILLSAEPEAIREAVRRMDTDPNHLRASDPGTVEGNVVFTYLDAFGENEAEVAELKARYRRGGIDDIALKRRLEVILQVLLAPIRERRAVMLANRNTCSMSCEREQRKREPSHNQPRRFTLGSGAVQARLKNWFKSKRLRRVDPGR